MTLAFIISSVASIAFFSMSAMERPEVPAVIIPAHDPLHENGATNHHAEKLECAIEGCPHEDEETAFLTTSCGHCFHLLCIQQHIKAVDHQPYRKYSAKIHEKAPKCPICRKWLIFNDSDFSAMRDRLQGRRFSAKEFTANLDVRLFVGHVKERETQAKNEPAAPPQAPRAAAANPALVNNDGQDRLDAISDEELRYNLNYRAPRIAANPDPVKNASLLEKMQKYGGDTALAGLLLGLLMRGELQEKPTTKEGAKALKTRRFFYGPTAIIMYALLYKMTPHAQWDYARVTGHVLGIAAGMAIPQWVSQKNHALRKKKEINAANKDHQTAPTTGSTSYKGDQEGQVQ